MKISLSSPKHRLLVATVAAVFAFVYVGFAAIQFAASWFGNSPELASLQRAVRLDPGNAEYRYHLGRYFDLVNHDPTSAVAQYTAAVRLNPHSARYWFDLASTYQILGDTANQSAALEHAIEADATTPDVAWEAGNLYLVQGQNEKALREFRVVVANDPSLANAALRFCWHIEPDVDALLRDVVPARSNAYLPLLQLLEVKQETAAAAKVWKAWMASGQPFELKDAYEYIAYSIKHKEVDDAVLAWRQAAGRYGLTSYLPSHNNLIVNNNFSLSILNAGFDWQFQKQPSVGLSLDPGDFHGGNRSLLITFDGPGVSEAGIYQLIGVRPGTTYDFSAYYKTGDMEGAGGAHFTIQDMYTQAVYYESDELREAGFWKSADGEFTTGPDCKLIVLHIRRLPSGSPIRGKLWVGDFHLTEKAPQTGNSTKS